jgi:site-specific recombinase XerD
MWDITKMLRFVGTTMPDSKPLSYADLSAKTLFLTMVFSACRITELTKLTLSAEGDGTTSILLNTNVKTRLEEQRTIVINAIPSKEICPLNAITELLRRRQGHIALVFAEEKIHAPLKVAAVSAALRSLMTRAGIDTLYSPYSIKHAVITYLFSVQAGETRINEFGRWSVSSRVAHSHYNIATMEEDWLGFQIDRGYALRN